VRRLAPVAALAALVCAGCGYRLAGTGTFLPKDIKTIAVAPFENKTSRPEIEVRTTEQVARQLSQRGGYKVVTDKNGADAFLEGTITETTVVLSASLRDLKSGEILWSQSNLVFRDQYDVQQVDVNYFDLETLALDDLAKGAAQTLVNSITEGF
jgi:TolB-like protein